MKRALISVVCAALAACATSRRDAAPRDESLKHLMVANGKLGWGGITLGMSRSEVQRILNRTLRVRLNPYSDVCGEHYSIVLLHDREIQVDWSDATEQAEVDVIAVPYGGSERMDYDEHLTEAAMKAVPALTSQHEEATVHFLVLTSDPEQAVNLKPSGEGVFFVTYTGCVD